MLRRCVLVARMSARLQGTGPPPTRIQPVQFFIDLTHAEHQFHRRRAVCTRASPHVLDQTVRTAGSQAAAPRRLVSSARRGGGRVRILGGRAHRRHRRGVRWFEGSRVRRVTPVHRAVVRVCHHGGRRIPAGSGSDQGAGSRAGEAGASACRRRASVALLGDAAVDRIAHHRTSGDDARGPDACATRIPSRYPRRHSSTERSACYSSTCRWAAP